MSCRSADRRIGGVPFFTFFVAPKLVGGNIRGNIRNWTQLQPLEILFPPHLQQQSHDFSLFGLLWREIVIIVTSEMKGFPQMFKSEPNPHHRLWMFRGLFPSESGTCWCLLNTEPLTSQQRSEVRVILPACLNDQPRLLYLQDFQDPTFYYLPCKTVQPECNFAGEERWVSMRKPFSQPLSSLGSHTRTIAVALAIFAQIYTCMQNLSFQSSGLIMGISPTAGEDGTSYLNPAASCKKGRSTM